MAYKKELERDVMLLSDTLCKSLTLESWSNGKQRVYQLYIVGEDGVLERQIGPSAYANEMEYMLRGLIEGAKLAYKT